MCQPCKASASGSAYEKESLKTSICSSENLAWTAKMDLAQKEKKAKLTLEYFTICKEKQEVFCLFFEIAPKYS